MDDGDCERTHSPIMQGMAGMTGEEEREYFREWNEDIQKRKSEVPDEPISALSFDPDELGNEKMEKEEHYDIVYAEPVVNQPLALSRPKTYRKLPIEIQGLQWTGTNVHAMREFVGRRDQAEDSSGEWNFLTPVEISGVMESSAIVWDSVQSGWIPVNMGDTILKGVSGEFYPISEDVLNKTYEEVK